MRTKSQHTASQKKYNGGGERGRIRNKKRARETIAKFSQHLQRRGGANIEADRKRFKKESVGKCESALRRSQVLVGGRDEMITSVAA